MSKAHSSNLLFDPIPAITMCYHVYPLGEDFFTDYRSKGIRIYDTNALLSYYDRKVAGK